MKSIKKLNENFPEHNAIVKIDRCENFIELLEKAAYKKAAGLLRKEQDMEKEHAKCSLDILRSHGWVDDVILAAIYEDSATISTEEKHKKITELENKINLEMKNAVDKCVLQDEFGKMFDELMKSPKSSDHDTNCMKKYCLEKDLVDANTYNLGVGSYPADCDAVMKTTVSALKQMIINKLKSSGLRKTQITCVVEGNRRLHFFDKTILVAFLSQIQMTEAQKAVERKKFVKFMRDFVSNVKDCV
jgi:hypothetical protein